MQISTRSIVVAGVLLAVSLVLGFTGLGMIPVPNVTGAATVMQVPAIIGGVLEGSLVGAIVGVPLAWFSVRDFSGIVLTSAAFVDKPIWLGWLAVIVILVLPRLVIGPAAWLSYRSLRRFNEIFALGAAGVLGTLTNTVLVIGLAVLLGVLPLATFVAVAPQALAEMIIAAVITIAVVAAWKRIETGRGGSSV